MSGIYEVGTEEEEIFSAYDYVKALERRIDKEIDSLTANVIKTGVDCYPSYKFKIGIIKGLNDVKAMMKDLRRSK